MYQQQNQSPREPKIYVGNGKQKTDYCIRVNIKLDDLLEKGAPYISDFNGKRYIALNINTNKQIDDHKNTHNVTVDTWKPDNRNNQPNLPPAPPPPQRAMQQSQIQYQPRQPQQQGYPQQQRQGYQQQPQRQAPPPQYAEPPYAQNEQDNPF